MWKIQDKVTVIKNFENLPEIKCYPQQLNQVVMNIFVNSAQATEQQGELCISTQIINEHVEIRISEQAKEFPKKICQRYLIRFLPPRKWERERV